MNMTEIKISTEYITLGQLLKLIGFIKTGSGSKMFLLANDIKVNNEIEKRRGRKLYPEDTIEIDLRVFIIKRG